MNIHNIDMPKNPKPSHICFLIFFMASAYPTSKWDVQGICGLFSVKVET